MFKQREKQARRLSDRRANLIHQSWGRDQEGGLASKRLERQRQ